MKDQFNLIKKNDWVLSPGASLCLERAPIRSRIEKNQGIIYPYLFISRFMMLIAEFL